MKIMETESPEAAKEIIYPDSDGKPMADNTELHNMQGKFPICKIALQQTSIQEYKYEYPSV